MRPDLEFERALRELGATRIAGIDEAGRGCLAGPVLAAAAILPADFRHARLDDSKRLTPRRREEIFEELTSRDDIAWAVAQASVEEIERLNILRATHLAMRRAAETLAPPPDHVLIDGNRVEPFPIPQLALVGGDHLSLSIAAASVIAKVSRDRLMLELHRAHPEYAFDAHKGYATAQHLEALRRHGPTPAYRRTFAHVAQMDLPFS